MNIRSAGLLLGGLTSLASCGTPGAAPTGPAARPFDLQAHRGGLGLVSESILASFANALELGVTTLELDTQVTRDGQAVVTHDRKVSAAKCRDTSPATPGDPDFPYVGKFITNLTLAQVGTLDCGSQRLADFPFQRLVPGITMPELRDVFRLVRDRADDVILNIETKVEAGAPSETAPRETFVRTVLQEIRDAGIGRQVTIQSFDWGALMLVRQLEPELPPSSPSRTGNSSCKRGRRASPPGWVASTSTTSRGRPSRRSTWRRRGPSARTFSLRCTAIPRTGAPARRATCPSPRRNSSGTRTPPG